MMLLSRGPKLNRSIELSCRQGLQRRRSHIAHPYSAIEERHTACPAGRGRLDLYREAAHLETEWRQLIEVGELLHMTEADVAARFVAFPNETRVAGFGKPLARERERRIPAPAVDAGHADALFEQKERGLTPHAAALVQKIGTAIRGCRRRIDEHDVERLERVTDA